MDQYSDRGNWEVLPHSRRCAVVATAAREITRCAEQFIDACASEQRTDAAETIAAELLPLCAALRWIRRRGAGVLRDRKYGRWGRPVWLWGVQSEVRRAPHGTVLVIGTWNYPLLLPGVQIAQALAAGNRVLLKPAAGTENVSRLLVDAFHQIGVPESSLQLLASSTKAAQDAIDAGVDLIVLTGSAETGRAVQRRAAESLTPTILELSGCDAVVLMSEVFASRRDLNRAVRAIRFGLTFNAGATCVAPRRLIVEDRFADVLIESLKDELRDATPATVHPAARASACSTIESALASGAVDCRQVFDSGQLREAGQLLPVVLDHVTPDLAIASADLFAPVTSVMRVDGMDQAVALINDCRYRLAASVFGSVASARQLASRLKVGSVVMNDIMVPTADPRLPFGGRGESGFGVTRGEQGLVAMTVPAVTCRRRGYSAPHWNERQAADTGILLGALRCCHAGTVAERWRGLRNMVRGGRNKSHG